MKNFKTLLVLLLSTAVISAQPSFIGQITGSSAAYPSDVMHDANGNKLVCGGFYSEMDLDISAGVSTITSNGDLDIWVAKYDPAGVLQWGFSIGGPDYDMVNDIETDEAGNIYITGHFGGTVDFDPSAGTAILTSDGDWDAFFMKLGPTGQLIWVKQIRGTGRQFANELVSNKNGYFYITGSFSGTADFDPSTTNAFLSTTIYLTISGTSEANTTFIAKYDLNGDYIWAHNVAGDNARLAVSGSGASEALYLTSCGKAMPTEPDDYDPSGNTLHPLPSGVPYSHYLGIIKYNSNCDVQWGRFTHMDGSAISNVNDLSAWATETDGQGNILVAGNFLGNMSTYANNFITLDNYGTVGLDGFLIKINSSGILQWQKQFGGSTGNSDFAADIALDNSGNIWITGGYYGTAELNSSGPSHTVTSVGDIDVFVAGFFSNGTYMGSGSLGGSQSDAASQLGYYGNRLFIAGDFYGTADVDLSGGVYNLTAAGFSDLYLNSFDESLLKTAALPINLLSFTGKTQNGVNILNWVTTFETNVAFHILERSTDGINWHEAARMQGELSSSTNKTYEWRDINPAIKTFYRLTTIDIDNRRKTYPVIMLKLNSAVNTDLSIYPNPARESFTLRYDAFTTGDVMRIITSSGAIIYSEKLNSSLANYSPTELKLKPGFYYVQIVSGSGVTTSQKLIIQ